MRETSTSVALCCKRVLSPSSRLPSPEMFRARVKCFALPNASESNSQILSLLSR